MGSSWDMVQPKQPGNVEAMEKAGLFFAPALNGVTKATTSSSGKMTSRMQPDAISAIGKADRSSHLPSTAQLSPSTTRAVQL